MCIRDSDYIDPGDINTGDLDLVTTGGGWDIVYMGDMGNPNEMFEQNPYELSIWAPLGVDYTTPQQDDPTDASHWTDVLSDPNFLVLAAGVVPKLGTIATTGWKLYNYFGKTDGDDPITLETQNASNIRVTDFDPRYDMMVLPILDVPSTTVNGVFYTGNYEHVFSNGAYLLKLDAEDGGTFATLNLDDGFYTEFKTAVSLTDETDDPLSLVTVNDLQESLWTNLSRSAVTFTSSGAQQGNAFIGLDGNTFQGLQSGQVSQMSGNVAGYHLSVSANYPYVSGSAQGDHFSLVNDNGISKDYYIAGFEGDDLLSVGNNGQEVIFDGGSGYDVISFAGLRAFDNLNSSTNSEFTSGITVNLSSNDLQTSSAPDSEGAFLKLKLSNVEGVEATDYNDAITGNTSANLLLGHEGNDTLSGAAGKDTLNGGGGHDKVYGGSENDSIRGEDGNDTLEGGDGVDYIFGGNGNDVIDGGNHTDYLYGGDGNDVLRGGYGAAVMEGGADNDHLIGGNGNDTMNGGTGTDTLYGWTGNDNMQGHDGVDFIYGAEGNDTMNGGSGNDELWGDGGNDILVGGAGQDWMRGGEGDDFLYGQADNDSLDGSGGNDFLTGDAGDDTLRGGGGKDTINGGDNNDIIQGEGHRDVIRGDGGHDVIYGGKGRDVLRGGAGNDSLWGEQGIDQFVFSASDGSDVVHDYETKDELHFEGMTAGQVSDQPHLSGPV